MTAFVLGCDIWCATVGEEHRLGCLRMGCEEGYLALQGEKRLRTEKLNGLYCSLGIIGGIKIKDDGMGEAYSMHVGEEICIEGFGKET